MEDYIGKVCPFCKTEIKEGDAVKVCPECNIPHHEECWKENKGCTTFGCKEQHYEAQGTNPTDVCANCGTPLGDGQMFCPNCGTPKGQSKKSFCSKCGAELQDGQEFCPKCGQKAGVDIDQGVHSAINQFNAGVKKTSGNKKKKFIILAVIIVIVIAFFAFRGNKGPDFNSLYSQYCSSIWAEVGSDGSYLRIDTNPYDIDDEGIAYYAAATAIENVNKALGLPDSLYSDMGQTTWSMGKQTETFDNIGVTVTWTYHPDKGLEVTYKKSK